MSTSSPPSSSSLAYKIAPKATWRADNFWSEVDRKDGYIHMSTRETLVETANKWYSSCEHDLVLVCVDLALQDNVRWEPSRNNELFPHIYSQQVNPKAIVWVKDLVKRSSSTEGEGGLFQFPKEVFE